jgi:hypothetical protein
METNEDILNDTHAENAKPIFEIIYNHKKNRWQHLRILGNTHNI